MEMPIFSKNKGKFKLVNLKTGLFLVLFFVLTLSVPKDVLASNADDIGVYRIDEISQDWKVKNEINGEWDAVSTYAYRGQEQPDPCTIPWQLVNGKFSQAIEPLRCPEEPYDGFGRYFQRTLDTPISLTDIDGLSIGTWIKYNETATHYSNFTFFQTKDINDAIMLGAWYWDTPKASIIYDDGYSNILQYSYPQLYNGDWHYFVFNFDFIQNKVKLYINGQEKAESNFVFNRNRLLKKYLFSAPCKIFGALRKWNFDDVFFRAGNITDEEVEQIYLSDQPYPVEPIIPTQTIDVAVILAEPYDKPQSTDRVCLDLLDNNREFYEKCYDGGHNWEYYNDLANNLVKDYYLENSYGTVDLNFEILECQGEDCNGKWYILEQPISYYETHRRHIIDHAKAKVDPALLTDDKVVLVVHSGNDSIGNFSLWNTNEATVAEDRLTGTWAHEIGHVLGWLIKNETLPDLYKMGLTGERCYPIIGCFELTDEGKWDLMATGSHNDSGKNPPHMSSYTKNLLQWLDYDIYPKSAYGEEPWINSLGTMEYGDKVFRYNLSNDTNEESPRYYILEARNRDKDLTKWDISLPEEKALVLYYVDKTTSPATINILGYSDPDNNAVLDPLTHETFEDLDNLVRFIAQSERHTDNQYHILAKIDRVQLGDFPPNRFASVILRPEATLRQRIPIQILTEAPFLFESGGYLSDNFITKIHNFVGHLFVKSGLTYKRPFFEAPLKTITKISIFVLWSIFIFICILIILLRIPQIRKRLIKIITKIILIIILFIIFCWATFILFFPEIRRVRPNPEIPGITESIPGEANMPDLDLHLYCNNGKHIGINYDTGEYENQISGALVSGDNQGGPEWIYIPVEINGDCHFVVSSYDNQQFLERNPEIAQQIEDKTDSYEVYARYIDPATDIYTSVTLTESIQPGQLLEQPIIGTTDIQVLPAQPYDTIPPITSISLEGDLGNNNWYISDVVVNLLAEDNESGVGVFKTEYSLDNGQTWNIYTEPFVIFQEGIKTIWYRSEDFVGNLEETKTIEIKIDKTEPEIQMPVLEESYVYQSNLTIEFSANDNVSGIENITATLNDNPIESGQEVILDKSGTNIFKVITEDKAGLVKTETKEFKVYYDFSGFLPPLKEGESYKLGRTITVKFQLEDADGNYVSDAQPRIYINDQPAQSSGDANEENTARYCSENNQYIFNLSTKDLSAGEYQIRADLEDGLEHIINIELKKKGK